MAETLACRLCLSTNIKLFNMFVYRLHTAYTSLTGIEMTASDGLPPYVCSVCSALLKKCATFRDMCNKTQNILQSALSQRVLSTHYIQSLKTKSPFAFSISILTKLNLPIDNNHEQNIKEELLDWDFEQDYEKTGASEINTHVKDEELIEPPELTDNDFPNGEVDEMILTKEEQIEEVQSRKTSMNYLNSFYKCKKCYKGFITDATYKNHMIRHDPSSGTHECEICHIRLVHMRALRAHVMTAHERKFVCKLCNHVSKSRHRAKEHSKWHSGHTFVCKFCGASFSKSTSHLTHIRLHHPSQHTCSACGESFIGETGLRMHMKRAHRGHEITEPDSRNRCENCGVQFHNEEALKRHTNDMENELCDLNLRACAQCGEGCPSEEELREHLKTHSKDESVKCEECNRTFAHERSFAVHYQRVHLRVRGRKDAHVKGSRAPVVCEICGLKCISNASLRYHQRTHTGERPYQCTECPKRFSIAQRLQIHVRTHTGERPYKCAACPKAFKHKAALNRHDRVHTGAKPYSCSHCGKSFSQSNSMKVHIRTVHLKQPSPYRARRTAVE
ncbi:hypothetical protein ABMA28_012734 [Loxostege sticticalis]|uniref:Uncharacterized protein n=1 Tax=Loxostege sticticalis TaxID=481309 RepID=A0ABD0S4W9_LOXSC